MKTLFTTACVALLATTIASSAHDYKLGDLVIEHPTAFETPKGARSGAGYLAVTNAGSAPDRLIAARAAYPRVEIHTTDEKDGVAKMRHVDGIDLPPGETIVLAPGGFHVMFMGLGDDVFEVGETVPATLVFEQAGEIDIMFNVEARDEAGHGGMKHGDSGHGAHD